MAKSPALESIKQERVKLEAALAAIVQREKEAEDALRCGPPCASGGTRTCQNS